MRVGFRLFDELSDVHPLYRGGDGNGTTAEVFPAASAFLLAGELRPKHETRNGFRRRVVRDCGLENASLPNIDRVDAALAALTGLEALAGRCSWVGDPEEGVVLLPTPLPEIPLSRRSADATPPQPTARTSAPDPRVCECGCGAEVRRRFLPGHDADPKAALGSAHSQVTTALRAGSSDSGGRNCEPDRPPCIPPLSGVALDRRRLSGSCPKRGSSKQPPVTYPP